MDIVWPTTVWDVGQDVSFRAGATVVNAEVKSFTAGSAQFRLGMGQLLEQVQNHADHIEYETPWYVAAGITNVVGILIVGDREIPEIWSRVGDRAGVRVWTAEEARAVFATEDLHGLLEVAPDL